MAASSYDNGSDAGFVRHARTDAYACMCRQLTVQLPFPAGPAIELAVTPATQTLSNAPAQDPGVAPERVYVDRVYREPVYVEPAYYFAQPCYYPGYYASPIYPFLGVALGYTWELGAEGMGATDGPALAGVDLKHCG